MFKSNSIFSDKEIVSQMLREARTEKKLSLSAVANKLKINIKYLAALENGDFNKLPEGLYGKNFLKEYAEFLNLDYKKLSKVFEGEDRVTTEKKNIFSNNKIKNQYLIIVPKIFKALIIISITVLLFSYLGFSLKKATALPELEIIFPKTDIILSEKSIEIKGVAGKEIEVSINGEKINIDSDGSFAKNIGLKTGLNTILITARKKYGKEKTVVRQILVEEN